MHSTENNLMVETKNILGEVKTEVDTNMMSRNQSVTTRSLESKEFKSSTNSSFIQPCKLNDVATKLHVESRESRNQQNGRQPIVQIRETEEIERITENSGYIQHERAKTVTNTTPRIQKQQRKDVAPRFVSSLTGMIVNQGTDVILEGIIDGYPTPVISWRKNGQDLTGGIKTIFEHNHVRLELENVNIKDAGRYTCSVENQVGEASSTADLVVKKTIFPPVFGKRLQAQIAKKGDRVIMEVEITGTPEPTVTWFKDDEPLMDRDGHLKQLGNCYLLIIDQADKQHAGKYMVNASNAGGEAQSIADFAVYEPTSDTMVELHKTIVYENVNDKDLKLEEKKDQLPSGALTAEHIATTKIQPSSTLKTLIPTTSSVFSTAIRKIELVTPGVTQDKPNESSVNRKATRSETTESTIQSHQSESKQEQKFHMKLEHQAPIIFDPNDTKLGTPSVMTTVTKISTQQTKNEGEPISSKTTELVETSKTQGPNVEENSNVETTTIAKKDALSFFESISKDNDIISKSPKGMVQLTEEDTDGIYDVKVDKLTKCYEKSTKFEETTKPIPEPPSKMIVHDLSNKLESPVSSKGIDNVMIDFPYDNYKLSKLNTQRTILEDTTASGSPIHGTLTISRLVPQSDSAEKMLTAFNLVPEPPPEIGYMPDPSEYAQARPGKEVYTEKNIGQEKKNTPLPSSVPVVPATKYGNVSNKNWSSASHAETISSFETESSKYQNQSGISNRCQNPCSPKPSTDGLSMEKSWAKKCGESNSISWPPEGNFESTKSFTKGEKWKKPEVGYLTATHEKRTEVEEIPGGGLTKTNIESSSTMETRSWSTQENRVEHVAVDIPKPNIETVKVQPQFSNSKTKTTQINDYKKSVETKEKFEDFSSKCDFMKQDISENKKIFGGLKAPGLVKAVSPSPKVQLYHHGYGDKKISEPIKSFKESSSIFKGTLATAPKRCNPVIGGSGYTVSKTQDYIHDSFSHPPLPFKTQNDVSAGKDYKPISNSSQRQSCENNFEQKYRRVQAPTPKPICAKSNEPDALPPGYEVLGSNDPSMHLKCTGNTTNKINRNEKSEITNVYKDQKAFIDSYVLKRGESPIYVQPNGNTDTENSKIKNSQQDSGYIADTDEPFHKRKNLFVHHHSEKEESYSHTLNSESIAENKSTQRHKGSTNSEFIASRPLSRTPVSQCPLQRTSFCRTDCLSPVTPVIGLRQFNSEKEGSTCLYSGSQTMPVRPQQTFSSSEIQNSNYKICWDRSIPIYETDAQDQLHMNPICTGSLCRSSGDRKTDAKEIIQPYLVISQKKPPLFTTPLKDIAVVSGHTARFECIVQAEPHPIIKWSRNGEIIENSVNYEVNYRNGVCGLVIPCAHPDDAGIYLCIATNCLGSTSTSSSLQVANNRRSVYL